MHGTVRHGNAHVRVMRTQHPNQHLQKCGCKATHKSDYREIFWWSTVAMLAIKLSYIYLLGRLMWRPRELILGGGAWAAAVATSLATPLPAPRARF